MELDTLLKYGLHGNSSTESVVIFLIYAFAFSVALIWASFPIMFYIMTNRMIASINDHTANVARVAESIRQAGVARPVPAVQPVARIVPTMPIAIVEPPQARPRAPLPVAPAPVDDDLTIAKNGRQFRVCSHSVPSLVNEGRLALSDYYHDLRSNSWIPLASHPMLVAA